MGRGRQLRTRLGRSRAPSCGRICAGRSRTSLPASKPRRFAPWLALAAILGVAISLDALRVDTVLAAAQAQPDRLETVLRQMDQGSAKFHSAVAAIRKIQFQKIVNDTATESGTIYFERIGSSIQVGARFDPPDAQTMEYKNGVLRLYSAGTNHIDVYPTGANQARVETFLTLGFGGSGSDLRKAWTITDQGPEQISDGARTVPVEKLDLVSKEASVRSTFTHITIWVDPVRDVFLKQESFAPSGDTNTTIYTDIRLNQPIDGKAFAIRCQGKCG